MSILASLPREGYFTEYNHEQLASMLGQLQHVAFDMDGTIYLGSELFPYTHDALQTLRECGVQYSFLTNNPTRSRADYVAKLHNMGITVEPEQVYTSAVATIDYMREHHPMAKRIYAVGTPSMMTELQQAGFTLCEDNANDQPDLLIVAFDTTLTYPKLCRAAYWASHADIPYIATNPDWVCPTNEPTILVDCGSICRAIAGATNREPDVVIGKPNPGMLTGIAVRYGLTPKNIAMVGDRIYTDVQTAFNAGSIGILTLSGETSFETAQKAPRLPDLVVRDIKILAELIKNYRFTAK